MTRPRDRGSRAADHRPPSEVELNGVAHLTQLRSVSLMGISIITTIYDDGIATFTARLEVLDRLQLVSLPNGVNP